jgi:type II secretory pathway pseudopilin PulG
MRFSRSEPSRPARGSDADSSGNERGVSGLVEMVVVVVILAILVAILLPNLLGAKQPAVDAQTQQNLLGGRTDSVLYYDLNGTSFPSASTLAGALQNAQPGVTFQTADSTSQGAIMVNVSGNSIAMTGYTPYGCQYLVLNQSAGGPFTGALGIGTYWATGSYNDGGGTECSSSQSLLPTSGWQSGPSPT